MSNAKFAPGDQVQLKSGGPDMVIEKVHLAGSFGYASSSYSCSWFVGGKHSSKIFVEEALIAVQEEDDEP